MANNKDIIAAATILNRLEHIPCEEGEWEAAFSRIERADYTALMMVQKLLQGKRHRVTSDNEDNIRRVTALAQELGATIDDTKDDPFLGPQPGLTSITIIPPQPR